MLMYVNASSKLPFSLFGLLSYLEPALMFVVAIVILQESFEATQWITYGLIWAATLTVVIDLAIHLYRQIRSQKAVQSIHIEQN
ncbi:hypothetical protein [Endozoicomonas montiporae]|uniref:hypothetical protein n=1 Tax=Endozoicomonas montiporae TaxID=1027273 RepID=UPI00068BFEE1|nr:hypothetical protein [Endozoicomonas montiporae]